MAESSPVFKLIQSVDPTKVKVPIRERFAKLTLSSNKKKQAAVAADDNAQLADSRRNVSRNIMDLFSDNMESDKEKISLNPLFRSDSPSDQNPNDEADANETFYDTQEELKDASMTDLMEPLQVTSTGCTQDLTAGRIDENVDALSLCIQSMAVGSSKASSTVSSLRRDQPISLSSTTIDSDDDNGDAITISDTSEHLDPPTNFDLVTSWIPTSGHTGDALLPNTLSNDKADRLEAFLQDVSQQRREMQQQQATMNDSLMTDHGDISGRSAKELAVADTESMSSYSVHSAQHTEAEEREEKKLPLDDTTPMSQSHSSIFIADSQPTRRTETAWSLNDEEAAKRMALNDTELNTQHSFGQDDLHSSGECSTLQSPTHHASIPENSVVISDTDEEEIAHDSPGNAKDVVPSEEKPQQSSDSSSSESSMEEIQMSMASINISAKINIKIQIPQANSSSEEDENGDSDQVDVSGNVVEEEQEEEEEVVKKQDSHKIEEHVLPKTQSSASEATQMHGHCEQRQQRKEVDDKHFKEHDDLAVKVEVEDEEFVNHAQTLLNELYGQSWQTKEALEVLQSAKKEKPTKTPIQRVKPTPRQLNSKPKEDRDNVEDSMVADFSIFRRNIEKTNLDSTRLPTNKSSRKPLVEANGTPKSCTSDKRLLKITSEMARKFEDSPSTYPATRKTTRSGRLVKQSNYKLLGGDSDVDTENASDDEDADRTESEWKNSSGPGLKHKTIGGGDIKPIRRRNKAPNELVYLDLSQDEVTIIDDPPSSPPANHDETFSTRLQDILRTCRHEDKPKLPASEKKPQSKRKLFTPNFGFEDAKTPPASPKPPPADNTVRMVDVAPGDGEGVINKVLEIVKMCKPVFELTPEKSNAKDHVFKTPTSRVRGAARAQTPKTSKKPPESEIRIIDKLCETPRNKYSFMKSLDPCAGKAYCHPDALYYRENYRTKKDELAKRLFELYNEKLFGDKLNVPIVWNKKLLNTAGRCLNKKKLGVRSSTVELSEKVLTSADRLRCTLVHELCHAATWIFNGEGGHGAQWKAWARQANSVFPDLPKIGVCHQYDIEYKYTYKCTLCGAKSHAHSKSKKVESIRCAFCHGAIEIFLNKKDKDGNVLPTPVKEPTGFAKFVKDNYKQYKQPDLKHADVMKILSNQFAALKVGASAK